ncbi:GNAT family N-acetyltransferase [Deinococcus koreensis]|uniref:GNAT family N-acetyltransferase n=1 Tax=Deinococcus koreensis TaxID=2054903 RepID=A0A2K3UZE2_9DEIO|nr:GNAT family N-acetyltransferase [Deinococcus koreensis]PNY81918.1 GNAT family N-acetyltransferase [Deinococcus koreensis]
MRIRFEALREEDVPLLTRWLQAEHVRAFWEDGERDEAAVRAHYFRVGRDVPGFIFSVDDRPAGFIQTEKVTSEHEFWPWATPVGETWATDLLIGEMELTGQGLGPQVIRAFIAGLQLQRPDLRGVVIDPDARNIRAIRAYAKAGFVAVGDPEERQVMLRMAGSS